MKMIFRNKRILYYCNAGLELKKKLLFFINDHVIFYFLLGVNEIIIAINI
jgi:hypothetical protein